MRFLCIILAAATLGGGISYAIFDFGGTMYLNTMIGRPRVSMTIEFFIAFIFSVSILSALMAVFLNSRVAPSPSSSQAAGDRVTQDLAARVARLEAASADRGAGASQAGPGSSASSSEGS